MALKNKGTGLQSAGFNIPKIKNNDILQKVSLTSRDAQDLLTEVDHSFLDHKYKQQWKLSSVEFVRSPEVEKAYRTKRSEMKEEGHSLQEQLCFMSLSQKFLAIKIAKEGFCVRPQSHNTLGNSSHGVYLWKHIDPQLRAVEKGDAFILVFKVTPGKCKSVPPSNSSPMEPTPNFDCHISNVQPRPTDTVREQFRRSLIYLYEYTEDAEPSQQPRHCLPYALLQYCHEEVPENNEASAYSVTKPSRVASHGSGSVWSPAVHRTSQETAKNASLELQKVPSGEQHSSLAVRENARPPTPPSTPNEGDGILSPCEKDLQDSTDVHVRNRLLHASQHTILDDRDKKNDAVYSGGDEFSGDEMDEEQLQRIIRQPCINHTRSVVVNTVRDPRLRRHSLETSASKGPAESESVVTPVQGTDLEPFQARTPNSVMDSMRKTVDMLLGRDISSQQDLYQDKDYRRRDHDSFNSWGLVWRGDDRWNHEERRGRETVGTVPTPKGSTSRGDSHAPCTGERDRQLNFDRHLLDVRPASPAESLLSDRDLVALADVDSSAQVTTENSNPSPRASNPNSRVETRKLSDRQESYGRLSIDEDSEYLVIDDCQCSETEESDCQGSDAGGNSPRVPPKRSPFDTAPSENITQTSVHPKLGQSSDAAGIRPLKSALKKPLLSDSVVAKVKKKLSLGDYKLMKQKMKEQRQRPKNQAGDVTVGEKLQPATPVDAAPTNLLHNKTWTSSRALSDASSEGHHHSSSAPLVTSPPNVFALLQSFAQVGSGTAVGDVMTTALNSTRVPPSSQNNTRDPRVRSALTTLDNHNLPESSSGGILEGSACTVDNEVNSISKCTQKSPVLARLAKLCLPEQNNTADGPSQLFFGQLSPVKTVKSGISDKVNTLEECTRIPESNKRENDVAKERFEEMGQKHILQSPDSIECVENAACDTEKVGENLSHSDPAESADASRPVKADGQQKKMEQETLVAEITAVKYEDAVNDSDVAALIRIAKGLRPGPSNHGPSPETSTYGSAVSSAHSSKESSPDLSRLNLPSCMGVTNSESDAPEDQALSKTSPPKTKESKSKGSRSNDPSPEVPLNDEEFEAMIRLAKGLRPGRRIQVSGLGKNPTNDPLPVLEGRGRSRLVKKASRHAAVKGSGSAGESVAGSHVHVQRKDKVGQQSSRKRGGGSKKRKHTKTEDQDDDNRGLEALMTTADDNEYDGTEGEAAGCMAAPDEIAFDAKSNLPAAEEKLKALPISTLGIRHWTEALVMPALDPKVQLTDLVTAYLKGADFDNCSICQKVIDLAAIDDTADDTPPSPMSENLPSPAAVPEEPSDRYDGDSHQFHPFDDVCSSKSDETFVSLSAVSSFSESREASVEAAKLGAESSSQASFTEESFAETNEHDTETETTAAKTADASDLEALTSMSPVEQATSETISSSTQQKAENSTRNNDINETAVTHAETSVPESVAFSPEKSDHEKPEDGVAVTVPSISVGLCQAALSDQNTGVTDEVTLEERGQSSSEISTRSEPSKLYADSQLSSATDNFPDDSILSTGFWKHPDEIEKTTASQNSQDSEQQGTQGESSLDAAISGNNKRSHFAHSEEDATGHKHPRVSQPWSSHGLSFNGPDIQQRRDLPGSRFWSGCSVRVQGSTKHFWQQWKNSQAVRNESDVERSPQLDSLSSGNQWSSEDLHDHDYRRGREALYSSVRERTISSSFVSSGSSEAASVAQPVTPLTQSSQSDHPLYGDANELQDIDYRPGRRMLVNSVTMGSVSLTSSDTSVSAVSHSENVVQQQPMVPSGVDVSQSSYEAKLVQESCTSSHMAMLSPAQSLPHTDSSKRAVLEPLCSLEKALLPPAREHQADVHRSQSDPTANRLVTSQGDSSSLFDIINKLTRSKAIPGLDLIMQHASDTSGTLSASETVQEVSEVTSKQLSNADTWSTCAQSFLKKYQMMTQTKGSGSCSESVGTTQQSLSSDPEIIEALKKKYSEESEVETNSSISDTKLAAGESTPDAVKDAQDAEANDSTSRTVTYDGTHPEEIRLNVNAVLDVPGTHGGLPFDKAVYEKRSMFINCKTQIAGKPDTILKTYPKETNDSDSDSIEEGELVETEEPAEKEEAVPQAKTFPISTIPSLLSTRDASAKKNKGQKEEARNVIAVKTKSDFSSPYRCFVVTPGQPAPPGVDADREKCMPMDLETFEQTSHKGNSQQSAPAASEVSADQGKTKKNAYDWFTAMLENKDGSSDGKWEMGNKEQQENRELTQAEPERGTDTARVTGNAIQALPNTSLPPPVSLATLHFDHDIRSSFPLHMQVQGPTLYQQAAPHAQFPAVAPFHHVPGPVELPPTLCLHPVPGPVLPPIPPPVPPPGSGPALGPIMVRHGIPPQEQSPHFLQPRLPGSYVGNLPRPLPVPGMGGPMSMSPVSVPVGIVSPLIHCVPPPGMSNTGAGPLPPYSMPSVDSTASTHAVATFTSAPWSAIEPEPPGTGGPSKVSMDDTCRMDTAENKKESSDHARSGKKDLLSWFSDIFDGKRDVSPESDHEPETKKARLERKESLKKTKTSREKESDRKKEKLHREDPSASSKSQRSSSNSEKCKPSPEKNKTKSGVSKISFQVAGKLQPKKRLQRSSISWDSDSECSDADKKERKGRDRRPEKTDKPPEKGRHSAKRRAPEKEKLSDKKKPIEAHISWSRSSKETRDVKTTSRWDMKNLPREDTAKDKKGEESEGLDEFAHALLEADLEEGDTELNNSQSSNIATVVMRSTATSAGSKPSQKSSDLAASPLSVSNTIVKRVVQSTCDIKANPKESLVSNETSGNESNTNLADKPMEYLAFAREMILKEMETLQGSQSDGEDHTRLDSPATKVASPLLQQPSSSADGQKENVPTVPKDPPECMKEMQHIDPGANEDSTCLKQSAVDNGQSTSAGLDTGRPTEPAASLSAVPEKLIVPGEAAETDAHTVVSAESFSDAPVTEEEISVLKDFLLKKSAAAVTKIQRADDSVCNKQPAIFPGQISARESSASGSKPSPNKPVPSDKDHSKGEHKSSREEGSDKKRDEDKPPAKRVKRSSGGPAWSDLLTSGATSNKMEVLHKNYTSEPASGKDQPSGKDSHVKPKERRQSQKPKQQQPQQKQQMQLCQERRPSGSQPASAAGHSYTLRDFLIEKFQVKNPESLAQGLPYELTMEMNKLSNKQRKRLRSRILNRLDQKPEVEAADKSVEAHPAPIVLLEEYPEDQIHIELGLVQECLNLLEAIQVTRPQQAARGDMWNPNRISMPGGSTSCTIQGSPEGMQFIQQTCLAQNMYTKVRDSLLSVVADFNNAIRDAQNDNKGRPHQRIPVAALLPEEVEKIYSREGISLIQLSAVPLSALQKLVQLKKDIESSWRRQRTFSCGNDTLGLMQEKERVNKYHALRANLLSTFCGRINKQRLSRLEMAVERYTTCHEHLQRVLGLESVVKMTFFHAIFGAIQNHWQIVAQEMHVATAANNRNRH